jgi:hypothetical protein
MEIFIQGFFKYNGQKYEKTVKGLPTPIIYVFFRLEFLTFVPSLKIPLMKKPWFALMLSLLTATTLVSCLNDTDEEDWRDANLAFMKKVAQRDGMLSIGDSVNGQTGIYYEVITPGDQQSPRPVIGDVVVVDYAGFMYDDTTAFETGNEFTARVGSSVIEGWSLALQQMHVGDYWRVYIPYYLAYGSTKYNSIPAYSALIFTIRLKEISTEH